MLSKVTTEIMAVSGNSLVRLGLSVLPLTAWVMAPLGVLRGLISGTGYGRMTAVSLVSEQLLAGGIGILAARLLFQSGEKASLVYGNPDYPAAFAAKAIYARNGSRSSGQFVFHGCILPVIVEGY